MSNSIDDLSKQIVELSIPDKKKISELEAKVVQLENELKKAQDTIESAKVKLNKINHTDLVKIMARNKLKYIGYSKKSIIDKIVE